jgi:hypothetical protein
MSESTRRAAEQAGESLQQAEKHIKQAGEYAKTSKDGDLVRKVEKLQTDTQQVREEIKHKLAPDAAKHGQ